MGPKRFDCEITTPALALDLADRIRAATGPHPTASDVLATALAATGGWAHAQRCIDEAVAEARRRGTSDVLPALEGRAALYRRSQPFIDRTGAGARC